MVNSKLIVSSELLSNYKAATIMPPDGAFSALQTTGDGTNGSGGHALLFSIGNDGTGYLTQESPGPSAAGWDTADLKAGWRRTDLSSATLKAVNAKAKQIAVAQNTANSNIHMALVASTSGDDLLHLSLNNSASDTSWVGAPSWSPMQCDDKARPFGGQLVISNVFISEASDGEYVVVDVQDQSNNTICRYLIDPLAISDPTKSLGTGKVWNQHLIPADIDPSTASTMLGRKNGQGSVFDQVDGLYTMGSTAGQAQLFYRPLYDPSSGSGSPYDPDNLPSVSYLLLPNQVVATAMTAVRRDDGFTDLFVASADTIYFFAADKQENGAQGVVAFSDPLVTNVKQLYGYRSNGNVVLWGLSAGSDTAHSVFYATCPVASIGAAGAWSVSPPLLTGVHRIAPFANKANNANNFFAHVTTDTGTDTLRRAMQAPNTSTWKHQDIRLQPPKDAPAATRSSAFTTRVQVNDANGQPLSPNKSVQISALHRTAVDINGFYQVLDTAPISVKPDARGVLNIIECVKTPQGTPLTIKHPDGPTVTVNPMTNVLKQATALVSRENPEGVHPITDQDLYKIRVPNRDGTCPESNRPLIPKGANAPSPGDVTAAAAALNELATIHADLPADGSVQAPAKAAAMAMGGRKISVGQVHSVAVGNVRAIRADLDIGGGLVSGIGGLLGGAESWVEGQAGDVFCALEQATNYVVGIAEDAETGIWHFVATIAGKTYAFVLDAAEKVAAAAVAIYKAIKAVIEDIIAWLEFLLDWGDFVRSMHVCKHVLNFGLDYMQRNAGDVRQDVDKLLSYARSKVDNWAGDSGAGKVDHHDKPPSFLSTLFDVSAGFTSPAMYFYNHFIDGMLGGSSGDFDTAAFDALKKALDDSADTMVAAIGKLQNVVVNFQSQNVEDTVKQTTAVVADAFLRGTNDVCDALFDVLAEVIKTGAAALDKPVHIPVISDIIEDVFQSSLHFTWLEFILMCGAIPGTLLYKSMSSSMPFGSGDGFSDRFLAADTLEQFLNAPPTAQRTAFAQVRMLRTGNPQGNPDNSQGNSDNGHAPDFPQLDAIQNLATAKLHGEAAKALFVVCHVVTGVAYWIKSDIGAIAATEGAPAELRVLSTATGVVAGVVGAASAMLAAPDPVEDEAFAWMQKVAGLLSLTVGLLKLAPSPYYPALADGVARVFQLVCTSYHLHELGNKPAGSERSAAYIDEVTTICTCLAALAEDGYVIAKDPETKAACLGVMTQAYDYASGLQFANAGVMGSS